MKTWKTKEGKRNKYMRLRRACVCSVEWSAKKVYFMVIMKKNQFFPFKIECKRIIHKAQFHSFIQCQFKSIHILKFIHQIHIRISVSATWQLVPNIFIPVATAASCHQDIAVILYTFLLLFAFLYFVNFNSIMSFNADELTVNLKQLFHYKKNANIIIYLTFCKCMKV